MGYSPYTELVLAAGTGSTGGLGKITTVPATTGTLLVRCDNSGYGRSGQIDWRVKSDNGYSVQMYRARSIVDAATITLGTAPLDDGDGFTLNGLVYTAEATAATADFASRKYSVAGNTAAQCTELAKLINADYSVVSAGTSVAATDKLVITTDEGAHTIVAAAAADYPAGKYVLGAAAAELASIVLAINHKDNVTAVSASAGDTVTINKGGVDYVYTGHATTTTAANREWDIAPDNTAAAALVTCINDATYGVPGVTASAASNVVSLTRNSQSDVFTLRTSNATRLATGAAGGVPGVIAAATGATGELCITPTWTKILTVTEAGDELTVTDIDNPGLYAVAGATTVTLSCTTPGGAEKANTIQFVLAGGAQAADANEATFASTTLTYLTLDGAAITGKAANSTTSNGELFTQWIDGWDQGYILISNADGDAQTVTVAATKY